MVIFGKLKKNKEKIEKDNLAYLFDRSTVCGVALPKSPAETPHVAGHASGI